MTYTLVRQLVGLGYFLCQCNEFLILRIDEKHHRSRKRIRPTDGRVVRLSQILINVSNPHMKKQRVLFVWYFCLYSQKKKKKKPLWNLSKNHHESKNHSPMTLQKAAFGQCLGFWVWAPLVPGSSFLLPSCLILQCQPRFKDSHASGLPPWGKEVLLWNLCDWVGKVLRRTPDQGENRRVGTGRQICFINDDSPGRE